MRSTLNLTSISFLISRDKKNVLQECFKIVTYLSCQYSFFNSCRSSCCAIWYHLKNVKNTHRRVLLLVKSQAKSCNLLNVTLLHKCFLRFLNFENGVKSRKLSHMYTVHMKITQLLSSGFGN